MEVRSFILANVNIERLTRQMQYWMSHDYIQDIMQNKIPDDIYGPRVTVDVQYQKLRLFTFNRKHGFSIDGKHQDLGPVNGQEPIKEANKLFYWMVSYIFNIYHQYRKSIEDLTTITAEKDPVKSEALRHQSFTYLPDKEFHALQMRLCKERLKQKTPLPAEVKESVQQELAEHRCKWVASTIATHFWQKKMVRGDDKMEVSDDNVIKRQRR